MKNEELYNRTVDILVQAYFDDTLMHGDPCGCAVGNLVAAGLNLTVVKDTNDIGWKEIKKDETWFNAIGNGNVLENEITPLIKQQICSTGYSAKQLCEIEFAFECCNWDMIEDNYIFNGLMAVIEVLDIIHENTDTAVTVASKQRFAKVL